MTGSGPSSETGCTTFENDNRDLATNVLEAMSELPTVCDSLNVNETYGSLRIISEILEHVEDSHLRGISD